MVGFYVDIIAQKNRFVQSFSNNSPFLKKYYVTPQHLVYQTKPKPQRFPPGIKIFSAAPLFRAESFGSACTWAADRRDLLRKSRDDKQYRTSSVIAPQGYFVAACGSSGARSGATAAIRFLARSYIVGSAYMTSPSAFGCHLSCCGARHWLRFACHLPTAATRSARYIWHRQRSHRSP